MYRGASQVGASKHASIGNGAAEREGSFQEVSGAEGSATAGGTMEARDTRAQKACQAKIKEAGIHLYSNTIGCCVNLTFRGAR